VAAKKTFNDALRRLTGYRLVRAPNGNAAAPQPKPAPPKPHQGAGPKLPDDYDDEAKEIIRAAWPYTMTAPDKLFALIQATRHVSRHGIPGDVVECGVWRGGSMHAAARVLDAVGDTARDVYLFDTYEGMPPPSDKDLRHDGTPAAELLAKRSREHAVWAVATLDDVQEGFEQVPYPRERVHFVKGLVEETVPAQAPEQIAILRLDTDWYESTRHELEHLYPRLVSGGVLLIDDYGWWKGSRDAVDEFLAESGERLLLLRMASGRVAVKP
jgi:O-methyltransferase